MTKRQLNNRYPIPVLGFVAYSGTGKTTLLEQVIDHLNQDGYRVGLVKHSHHDFDIDHPRKDSYRLRKAGARQVVIASRSRLASITELPNSCQETSLATALAAIDFKSLDIILVEGYKAESFDKIELHRSILGKPLLFPGDQNIIAIAIDRRLEISERMLGVDVLSINSPIQIVDYIVRKLLADV